MMNKAGKTRSVIHLDTFNTDKQLSQMHREGE